MPAILPDGPNIAKALVRHGVLCKHEEGGGGKYVFPIPKNESKASMTEHLVHFNKQQSKQPVGFHLPLVEDLAFLIQTNTMRLPNMALARSTARILMILFFQCFE